jgi:hypothetical protein
VISAVELSSSLGCSRFSFTHDPNWLLAILKRDLTRMRVLASK